jgi:hypothetical protein
MPFKPCITLYISLFTPTEYESCALQHFYSTLFIYLFLIFILFICAYTYEYTPSLPPLTPPYLAETILPLSLILLKREYKQ